MQLTTLFLAAAASGLSLARTIDLGQWEIIYERSWDPTNVDDGYARETITANYTSSFFPGEKGLIRRCKKNREAFVREIVISCDDGFKASYNGSAIHIKQTFQKPDSNPAENHTVYGSDAFEAKYGLNGQSASGRGFIKAQHIDLWD